MENEGVRVLVDLSMHYLRIAREAAMELQAKMPDIASLEVVPADHKAEWSWCWYEPPIRVEVYHLPELLVDVRRIHFVVKLIGGHFYWSGFNIPIKDLANPRLSGLWIKPAIHAICAQLTGKLTQNRPVPK